MDRRRHLVVVGVVVVGVVVAGLVAAAVGPASADGSHRTRTTEVGASGTPCAVPGDCRLDEAAGPAGIRVGLATWRSDPPHAEKLASEANLLVNHQFSWSGIEPERGAWDFAKADVEDQFARDHGMFEIGMHFAWDQAVLDDLPDWVGDITDPAELRAVLRHRAEVIFGRYPDLRMIDVINEPLETVGSELYRNHFYDVLGPDYIDELFSIVESVAPPTVTLIVNEGGIEYQPEKAAHLVRIAEHLKARGHRIGGVGIQAHLSAGEPNWQLVYDTMHRLDQLGIPPFITEIDVPVPPSIPHRDQVQAERYRRAAAICLAVPSCTIFDVWGVSDANSWYDGSLYPGMDPLLFDEDFRPKLAYRALRDQFLAGRPAAPGPPDFLSDRTDPITGGDADAALGYACRPTEPLTRFGYGEIASVTDTYVGGNAVAIPVAAHATWARHGVSGRSIARRWTLPVDMQELAHRYLEESARPAIGLGGHHDLVDTVWLVVTATDVQAAPTGPGSPAGTVLAEEIVGDSRHPRKPVTLQVDASTNAPATAVDRLVDAPPPELHLTLRVELGVVFQGSDVSGGVTAPFTCRAVGDMPLLRTAVRGAGSALWASARPAPPAVAVVGRSPFTG